VTKGRPIYTGGPIYHRMILGYVILAIACVLGLFLNFRAVNDARHVGKDARQHLCVAINNLNGLITGTLARSRENIPHLSYYRAHPTELRAQLREIDLQIHRFRPRKCV
jgi:hypothetical protein